MKKCKICDTEIRPHRTYCSNKCKFSDLEYNKSRSKKSIKNTTGKYIECNICGKTYNDALNISGVATKHLTHAHNLNSVSYLDYFTIHHKNIIIKDKWKCPICNWETIDAENKSGIITKHLQTDHKLDMFQFNLKYPTQKIKSKKADLIETFSKSKQNYITCKICGKQMHIISNTHCKNIHGITQQEYKEKYGDVIVSNMMSSNLQKCGGTKSFVSKGETEIFDYLKEIGISDATQTYRTGGIEIDIYSPSFKIGIEFNGLYWHSEKAGKSKDYHIGKTNFCESKGIKLIHIFDDEWNNKKEIIKNRLNSIFNINPKNRLYARNCIIREIDKKTKSKFLNEYHLQGNDKSLIHLGAFYNNILVSVITFSKKRKALGSTHTAGIFELNRFVQHSDYSIYGILNKFISYFKKNYTVDTIITYADRRYSNKDNVYSKSGFNYISTTKPNYFYTKNYSQRLHRFNLTKHRLVELGGDINKTEWENAISIGYDRIWDCGNFKYEIKF